MYSISKKKIDVFWLVIIMSALILMYWQGIKNDFCREWGKNYGIDLIATRRTYFEKNWEIRILENCKRKSYQFNTYRKD